MLDLIPEIIRESGSDCRWRKVYGEDEHIVFLRAKMNEEMSEFVENPCYEEAADIVEVIKSFCHLNSLEWEAVLGAAERKQEERGGFTGGVILEEVL